MPWYGWIDGKVNGWSKRLEPSDPNTATSTKGCAVAHKMYERIIGILAVRGNRSRMTSEHDATFNGPVKQNHKVTGGRTHDQEFFFFC
jgi:hypothetical protein